VVGGGGGWGGGGGGGGGLGDDTVRTLPPLAMAVLCSV